MIGNAEGHENVPTHYTNIVESRAEIDYHCQLNRIKNELTYNMYAEKKLDGCPVPSGARNS